LAFAPDRPEPALEALGNSPVDQRELALNALSARAVAETEALNRHGSTRLTRHHDPREGGSTGSQLSRQHQLGDATAGSQQQPLEDACAETFAQLQDEVTSGLQKQTLET
jgi:hypothetical protein